MRYTLFLLLATLGCASTTPEYAVPDIEYGIADPDFPRDYAETRRFAAGKPVDVHFTPDGDTVLFRRSGPRDAVHDLFAYDVPTGKERLLLSAEPLLGGEAEELSAEELARRERMRLSARGITSYELSKDGTRLLVPLSGSLFVYDMASGAVSELTSEGGYPIAPRLSPDGTKVAVVREGDLYVIDIPDNTQRRLTDSATGTLTNGLSEFVAQEEMGRMDGFWWAPDSARLIYQETDESPVEVLYIADAVHPETPPAAKRYPRPGTANVDVRLGIVSIEGGDTTWLAWDRGAYPYLVNVRWSEDAPPTILVQNRHQTEMVLLRVDPGTGKTTELLRESDPAWLNIDQQMPKWLPGGESFLWTSEREGHWNLYEFDGTTGAIRQTLTKNDHGYRSLVSVSNDGAEILFYGSTNPLARGVYRIHRGADGAWAPPHTLFPADVLHTLHVSDSHERFVYVLDDGQDETPLLVHDATQNRPLGELRDTGETPPELPNVEYVMAGHSPAVHCAIIRPRDFDPRKKYPVIEAVYGGPHANVVSGTRRAYYDDQWLADHGFIVVAIDGRGTPNRGRDWERAIKGDFISAPLADHVAALQDLGRKYPEMDLDRVGIHGWSFGGYFTAMAVMQHPELYKAGIAGAPVVDWRDYDTHYTERYIGLPGESPDAYDVSNVLTYADRLKRPLLILHGTTDDNVFFMHSLKLTSALLARGIDHQFLPLTNFTHMVADTNIAARRMELTARYFVEHLR